MLLILFRSGGLPGPIALPGIPDTLQLQASQPGAITLQSSVPGAIQLQASQPGSATLQI